MNDHQSRFLKLFAESPLSAPPDLSDAEREQHVVDLGRLMLTAYALYEATGDLQYRGEADRYRIMQAEAIKARRPGYAASLEVARGLAG